jgi:hypothetical protein
MVGVAYFKGALFGAYITAVWSEATDGSFCECNPLPNECFLMAPPTSWDAE